LLLAGTGYESSAHGIAVSGSDVYVAGFSVDVSGHETAAYWMNGAFTELNPPSGNLPTYATGIAVSGGDVCVSGYVEDSSGNYSAVVWVNGVVTLLPMPSGMAQSVADGIAVSTQ
jgi:uncharacterized membrane protein